MSKKTVPYPDEMLPEGFRYPVRYIQLSKGAEFLDRLVWWFPDSQFNHAMKQWKGRHIFSSKGWKLLDEIDPIPFARNGDWAALFNGNDHSGDPRIVVADYGNKRNSYWLPNFDAWLERAFKDSGIQALPKELRQ